MNIYLASDLHIEFFKDFQFPAANEIDVVILAGDICPGTRVLEVAQKFQRHCEATVIVVAGNHEFYGYDHPEHIATLRRDAQRLMEVFFLENESVIIGGVRFLGCTLWTNFALFGDQYIARYKSIARNSLTDFDVIRHGNRRFTPDDAAVEFERSYTWLETELAKPFSGKTVVVTHFLPHREGIHPQNATPGNNHLIPYFTSDCSPLMQKYPISLWTYGHTHNSVDVVVENGVRLVSNQRGYPNENQSYTQFDVNKIIRI